MPYMRKLRPVPSGFADAVAQGLSRSALSKRFGASDDLVKRWLLEGGDPPAPKPTPSPRHLLRLAPELTEPPPEPPPTPSAATCDPLEASRQIRAAASGEHRLVVETLCEIMQTGDASPSARVAAAHELVGLIGPPPPLPPAPIPIPSTRVEYLEAQYRLIASRLSRASGDAPAAALARRLDAVWSELVREREAVPDDPFDGLTDAEIRERLRADAEGMHIDHLAVFAEVYRERAA